MIQWFIEPSLRSVPRRCRRWGHLPLLVPVGRIDLGRYGKVAAYRQVCKRKACLAHSPVLAEIAAAVAAGVLVVSEEKDLQGGSRV